MNLNEVTLREIKKYHKLEMIKSFRAVRNPLNKKSWLLEIYSHKSTVWVLNKAAGGIKDYDSLDALVKEVERITEDTVMVKEFVVL